MLAWCSRFNVILTWDRRRSQSCIWKWGLVPTSHCWAHASLAVLRLASGVEIGTHLCASFCCPSCSLWVQIGWRCRQSPPLSCFICGGGAIVWETDLFGWNKVYSWTPLCHKPLFRHLVSASWSILPCRSPLMAWFWWSALKDCSRWQCLVQKDQQSTRKSRSSQLLPCHQSRMATLKSLRLPQTPHLCCIAVPWCGENNAVLFLELPRRSVAKILISHFLTSTQHLKREFNNQESSTSTPSLCKCYSSD